nr:hypothetical protein [Calothrix sp. PCC 6303]
MHRKYRFLAVVSFVCILLSIFSSYKGVSQTPSAKVQLVTNPAVEKIIPFRGGGAAKHQEPVTMTFQALDATGKPVKDAKIGLEILTPSPTPFWTTDFPIVEGTKLLKMETAAPEGKLEIREMLPIRGRYQFNLNVAPLAANSFQPYEQTLFLNVSENPVKFKYLAVTVAILLAVGLLGGLVIGGQQELKPGEIAPYRVRLLLSGLIVTAIALLLFINITAEVAEAHGGEKHNTEVLPAVQKVQGLDVRLEGNKDATVGKMADYSVQVKDGKTGESIKDVVFQVKAVALEDNLPIFAYKAIPDANGKLTWQQQFFDGAPHKIQVEATPKVGSNVQFPPVKVEQEVEVEGIAPPLYIRFVSLFYFTAIVGIGMAMGLWLQNKLVKRTA